MLQLSVPNVALCRTRHSTRLSLPRGQIGLSVLCASINGLYLRDSISFSLGMFEENLQYQMTDLHNSKGFAA